MRNPKYVIEILSNCEQLLNSTPGLTYLFTICIGDFFGQQEAVWCDQNFTLLVKNRNSEGNLLSSVG
jgi:hypothetical protein